MQKRYTQSCEMSIFLEKLYEGKQLSKNDFLQLLVQRNELREEAAELAMLNRIKHYGKSIYFRALIEISSYCKQNCLYCGIRAGNLKAERFRMDEKEILAQVDLAYENGFRTIVMQGGEDPKLSDDMIVSVIKKIKDKYDIAITLSLGEKTEQSYRNFKNAGADRYLLRHETATSTHYSQLHPNTMCLETRLACIQQLQKIGFQVGMGMMIGSPYQTLDHIAEDLLLIQSFHPQMVGVGPFIHHEDTPFANFEDGKPELVYYVLSILRIMHPQVLLPITTALGTLDKSALENGLRVGGNVIMPNMSPETNKIKYAIYKNKADYKILQEDNLEKLKKRVAAAGFVADMQVGHYKGDL